MMDVSRSLLVRTAMSPGALTVFLSLVAIWGTIGMTVLVNKSLDDSIYNGLGAYSGWGVCIAVIALALFLIVRRMYPGFMPVDRKELQWAAIALMVIYLMASVGMTITFMAKESDKVETTARSFMAIQSGAGVLALGLFLISLQ